MTLTDAVDSSKEDRELDRVAPDQTTDQTRAAMDLDPADDERAPISLLADNACASSGPLRTNGIAGEPNFRAPAIEGMDIEQGEVEKQSAARENSTAATKVEIERKSDHTDDYGHKAEVSSSRGGDGVAVNNIANPDSPANESSPVSRPRRSDSSRPGLRKLTTAKTRSSSLTNSQRSAKFQDGATPESKGSRKRGEDGEELRQTSSSEELEGDGDEVDGTGYRCGICNEDFESAKSLSLHKKYHPQYTLRRNPKRSRKLIDQEYTIEGGVATPVPGSAPTAKKTSSMSEEFPKPCTECGKEFPSWKALFGHMRCHPEREWRGIQPPTEKSNHPQGSGPHAGGNLRRKKQQLQQQQHQQQPAQLPPPPPPSVTEDNDKSASLDSRRAGKASDNESDTESIEAAYMSNGDRHAVMGWMKRSKRSRQTHRSLDAVNSAKTESNDMIEALMLLQSADKENLTLVLTPDSHGRKSRSKSRTPEFGLDAEVDELPQRDRNVKMEADEDDASPSGDADDGGDDFDAGDQSTGTRSKYECTTCKRQFKSHQALGGHRASHKKVKGCFARTNVNDGGAHEQSQESMDADDEELNLKSEEQLLPPSELLLVPETSHNSTEDESNKPCAFLTTAKDDNEEMLNRKAKAHECSICHRVFTSGQALGGHKRCHWGGGSGTPEVTSASKPVQTGQQSRPLKEGVQLDLNLPAPECLEEMAQQQGMEAAGMSNYMPGASLSFFNIMTNSRNSYADSPAEQAAPPVCESEPSSSNNNINNSNNPGEPINNQFSNFERAYHAGPLDSLTIHPKPHVASMALVPGLTPTSA